MLSSYRCCSCGSPSLAAVDVRIVAEILLGLVGFGLDTEDEGVCKQQYYYVIVIMDTYHTFRLLVILLVPWVTF